MSSGCCEKRQTELRANGENVTDFGSEKGQVVFAERAQVRFGPGVEGVVSDLRSRLGFRKVFGDLGLLLRCWSRDGDVGFDGDEGVGGEVKGCCCPRGDRFCRY